MFDARTARGARPRRATRVRLEHSGNVQLCRTTGGAEVAWLDVERRELFTDEPPAPASKEAAASARKPEDTGAGTADGAKIGATGDGTAAEAPTKAGDGTGEADQSPAGPLIRPRKGNGPGPPPLNCQSPRSGWPDRPVGGTRRSCSSWRHRRLTSGVPPVGPRDIAAMERWLVTPVPGVSAGHDRIASLDARTILEV